MQIGTVAKKIGLSVDAIRFNDATPSCLVHPEVKAVSGNTKKATS